MNTITIYELGWPVPSWKLVLALIEQPFTSVVTLTVLALAFSQLYLEFCDFDPLT